MSEILDQIFASFVPLNLLVTVIAVIGSCKILFTWSNIQHEMKSLDIKLDLVALLVLYRWWVL